jgi:nucleotide-binding universal stress UspA family protein
VSGFKIYEEVRMFKHILLPTDGSSLSHVAIQKGVQLAKAIKAKITGITVIPEQEYYLYQMQVRVNEETVKQHKVQANRNLSVIEKAAKDVGVPCDTFCEISDHPYETIVKVAEKRGCDLIMMASHGRRGVGALLIGSETQRVLTHSKIPVLVYR